MYDCILQIYKDTCIYSYEVGLILNKCGIHTIDTIVRV